MEVGICLAGGVEELQQANLDLLNDIGITTLYVGCYENEMRWQAEEVSAFVRTAGSRGFEVWAVPWGYGKVVDPDPAVESLYVDTHRPQMQIDSRGRRCAKACPNNPTFLEWFASSMRTLAWMLEIKGFMWDEPSFYYSRGTWSCRCEYCQRLFYASENYQMPRELTEPVREFRRFSVLMFILAAAAAVQAVDPRLFSMVMPTPTLDTIQDHTGTDDWGKLLQSSAVDSLALYIPWQERQAEADQAIRETYKLAAVKSTSHGKPCHIWISASPRPQDKVLENLRVAYEAGAASVVLSDYATFIDPPGIHRILPRLRETVAAVRA